MPQDVNEISQSVQNKVVCSSVRYGPSRSPYLVIEDIDGEGLQTRFFVRRKVWNVLGCQGGALDLQSSKTADLCLEI